MCPPSSLVGRFHQLILDSRDVVREVDAGDLHAGSGSLDLAPLVDDQLDVTVLLKNLGKAVANSDGLSNFHLFDLVIHRQHVHAAELVANNALSLPDLRSIVSSNLLCQFRFVNLCTRLDYSVVLTLK